LKQSIPLKHLAEPSEIADVIFFLASDKNAFINGQTIFVDGGYTCQ
jgi:NAD(P)-dependent dehydrogenase (short-subunit alcohol dehydrogenase family)